MLPKFSPVKNKVKYIVILVLSFIVYGNTLFHDYALDDAIVITENEYTLNGFAGIKDILSEDSFSGFFEQKGKKLVAGGRYRPLSVVTFAIEWELIMGSPFRGVDYSTIKSKLDKNANSKFILPSNKLLKDLSRTIHTENRNLRLKQQELILNRNKIFNDRDKEVIKSNLGKMHSNRSKLLFISHFVNVLFFALTCMVLLFLLEYLLAKYPSKQWYLSLPFVVTLIFLAHPIHTEVVANIKGRDEIFSLLGSLLAMLFVFKFMNTKRYYHLLLIFIFFSFALFSKELAVTFIAIIPLSIYFFSKQKRTIKDIVITGIPLVLATLIYFYIRHKVVGDLSLEPSSELMNNSFLGMSFSERYATIFYTLLIYLKLLIFPHPLTFDYYPYHISIMNWSNILPIISLIIYFAMGIYSVLRIKQKSLISFGILFYLITLSPTSNILFPIGVFMNERFVYASSLGIILVIAYFITNKIKNQQIQFSILVVLMLGFSMKTISRNRAWKNDFTLFTTDVKISENSAKSNTSAGGKLIEEAIKPENKRKRTEYLKKSISYLGKAIEIHPKYKDAYLLMGNAQWELYHSLDSMFKYYDKLLQINPRNDRVYSNIFETTVNSVFNEQEKANSNITILHRLEKYNPSNYYVNYYLGKVYGRYLNDLEKSKMYLVKASKINPNDISVFKDLGVAYGMLKDYKNSAQALIRAVELDDSDPFLKLNLVMTYANLKDYKNASQWMDSIYEMDIIKGDAKVLVNLSQLYHNFNNNSRSRECLERAKSLNPDLFSNDKQ